MVKKVVSINRNGAELAKRRMIPERLIKARKSVRLTQTDLASEIGVTRQSVSAYEQGAKSPDSQTLLSLAKALDQPLQYFTGAMPEPIGPFSVKTFRAFGASTRRRNDQCEVLSEWVSSIVSLYQKFINFPKFDPPSITPDLPNGRYSFDNIEEIADSLRKQWGLGSGPIGNMIKLVEAKGVIVSHLPISEERINAFSFWSGEQPFIFMASDSTTAVRTRFDIAHELGHLILHQGISEEELEDKKTLKQIEAEANRFGSAFLMPAKSYINEVHTTRLDSFTPLKKRWLTSIASQVYRCSDLGIFSSEQVLNLRKQISARKWRTHEPLDSELKNEKPELLKKAATMLIENKIISKQDITQEIKFNPTTIELLSNLPPGFLKEGAAESPVAKLELK